MRSLVLASWWALGAAGCSLLTTDRADCTEHAECRVQFGFGSTCGEAGFCETDPLPDRCAVREPFPADLLDSPASVENTVVFGSLMDRSVETRIARENAAQLALSLANDEGGLPDGRRFGMIFCTIEEDRAFDTLEKNDAALEAGRYLADVMGVPAIFGPSTSNATQVVFRTLVNVEAREVLFISPSATSPALTALDPSDVADDKPGLLWRTAPPDSLQGVAIAEDMVDGNDGRVGLGRTDESRNVSMIYEGGAYGDGLAKVFQETMLVFGANVQGFRFETDAARAEAITTVGIGDADEVIFISADPQHLVAFIDAAELGNGYENKRLFFPDAAANPDVTQAVDPSLRARIRGSRPAPPAMISSVHSLFVVAYTGAFNGQDPNLFSFTAHAYDAAWLLALSSVWAALQEGGVTARGMAKGMRRVSSGMEVPILSSSFNTVKQQFEVGASIDVEGASGGLDFDPATEETSGPIEIWQIDAGGQIEGIEVVGAE